MTRPPSGVLAKLMEQHAALRDMIASCVRLADELDRGRGEASELSAHTAALRIAFEAHNRYEEQFLRPVLAETDGFAEVRIDRMIADHVDEHRLVGSELASPITRELRTTLDHLRRHLDAEERYFLSSRVLRDDLVVVESGG